MITDQPLPAAAGMNRFVWNLRYDDRSDSRRVLRRLARRAARSRLPGGTRSGYRSQAKAKVLRSNSRSFRACMAVNQGLGQKFALSMQVYHDQDALHRAVQRHPRCQGRYRNPDKKQGARPARSGRRDCEIRDRDRGTADAGKDQEHRKESQLPRHAERQIYNFAACSKRRRPPLPSVQEDPTYAGLQTRSWPHSSQPGQS